MPPKPLRPTTTRLSPTKPPAPRKAGNILDRIGPIQLPDTGLRVGIYGHSGSGKTTVACTFPKPLLLIGVEEGTRSVHNVPGVEYVYVQQPAELRDLFEHLSKGSKYQSAVLDTVTRLRERCIEGIIGRQLPTQMTFGVASMDQWGQCSLQVKDYLRDFLALSEQGTHTVILAQQQEYTKSDDDSVVEPYVSFACSQSINQYLCPAVDYIMQAFKGVQKVRRTIKVKDKPVIKTEERVQWYLRTGPHEVYRTKFRVPRGYTVPDSIPDPTFDAINAIIQGTYKPPEVA